MQKNILYINKQTGEKTVVCIEDIVHTLNSMDRLIDIDNTIGWNEMCSYKPNRKFTMFVRENKRIYLFL